MEPVCTIVALLASFAPALTARTLENLGVLLRGALLATGQRTVTACLVAAWPWVSKHWSAYENVFRRARLNLSVLARTLCRMALALVPSDAPILLVIDESLVRRYGPYVPAVGMHRDAVRSSRGRHQTTPGHKWVVLGVVVRLPFMDRPVALPVFSVLYTSAKLAKRNRRGPLHRRHRTVVELALLMVRWVVRWAPGRRFCLVGDGAYGTHELAGALQAASKHPGLRRVRLVSRFQFDGATFAPPPAYSGRGRPRVKGERLPSPAAVAADPATPWERVGVAWYGATHKVVLVCSRTGLWYRKGSGGRRSGGSSCATRRGGGATRYSSPRRRRWRRRRSWKSSSGAGASRRRSRRRGRCWASRRYGTGPWRRCGARCPCFWASTR